MMSLTKLQHKSEDSHGMVLASPSASQTHRLALDFKACINMLHAAYIPAVISTYIQSMNICAS